MGYWHPSKRQKLPECDQQLKMCLLLQEYDCPVTEYPHSTAQHKVDILSIHKIWIKKIDRSYGDYTQMIQ